MVGPGDAGDIGDVAVFFVGEAEEADIAFSGFSSDLRDEGEVARMVDVCLGSMKQRGAVIGCSVSGGVVDEGFRFLGGIGVVVVVFGVEHVWVEVIASDGTVGVWDWF